MPSFEQVNTKFKSAYINTDLVTYIDKESDGDRERYYVHFAGGDFVAFPVDDPSRSLDEFIKKYAPDLRK